MPDKNKNNNKHYKDCLIEPFYLMTNVLTVDEKVLVKLVAWYDNEYGYTYQMLNVAKKLFK